MPVEDKVEDEDVDVVDETVDSDTDNEDPDEGSTKRKSYKSEAEELKKEVEAMRKVIAERNKEAEKRRKQVKQWEELGVDTDTVKEMLTAKEKAEHAKMEEKGEWEKIKDKMNSERDRMISEKDDQIQSMKRSLENTLWDKGIETELLSNGADAPELVKDKVKVMTKLVEDNGVFDIAVLDDSGEIRYTPNGERMKLKDMILELKEHPIYGRAFPAPNITGMGTKPQGAGNPSKSRDSAPGNLKRNEMTPRQKQEYVSKWGAEKFNSLPRS